MQQKIANSKTNCVKKRSVTESMLIWDQYILDTLPQGDSGKELGDILLLDNLNFGLLGKMSEKNLNHN